MKNRFKSFTVGQLRARYHNLKVSILFMILLCAFTGFFFYLDIMKHEEGHRDIFREYGYESTIEWKLEQKGSDILYAQTSVVSGTKNITLEDWDEMNYLHTLNEIHNPTEYGTITFRALVLSLLSVIAFFPVQDDSPRP